MKDKNFSTDTHAMLIGALFPGQGTVTAEVICQTLSTSKIASTVFREASGILNADLHRLLGSVRFFILTSRMLSMTIP